MATYTDEQVNPIIDRLLAATSDALGVAKAATEERDALAARLAAMAPGKVVLQKVAADENQIKTVVDGLISNDLLEEGDGEKLATELRADPTSIFKLASRLISLSASAPQPGGGLPKSASEQGSVEDPDGWSKMITHKD